MSELDPVVIVSATRTPMGGFLGELSPVSSPQLGSVAIKEAVARANLTGAEINEVIMGCVLPAGVGQAPARQAAIKADIPVSVGAMTVNKVCGSGMQATMLAHDLIKADSAEIVVAGGMESMSNAPYMLPKVRSGMRIGHGQMVDHMMFDGLEDAYQGGSMGSFAQSTADQYQYSRERMDQFAIDSLRKAQLAIESGWFDEEVVPVTYETRRGAVTVKIDEQPGNARFDKIPTLKPAFAKDGTITAATSSSISDGAAALVLMRASEAAKRGLTPLCKIVAHATHSQAPETFTTAPVGAIKRVLDRSQWSVADVDLFEINEAFAMVTLVAIDELNLDPAQVNVHGGACALGHPIGASGARLIVSLIYALQQKQLNKGVASLCIGGGEATAIAIELL